MTRVDFIDELTDILHKKGFAMLHASRVANCIAADVAPAIMEDDSLLKRELFSISNALTALRIKIDLRTTNITEI